MIIWTSDRTFPVRPCWVVTGDPEAGGQLADMVAITTAMMPVGFRSETSFFPYRQVALALHDGLLYSPTLRALARRGLNVNEQAITFVNNPRIGPFRTAQPHPRSMMDAIGLNCGDSWEVIADIYGLPNNWKFLGDPTVFRSLLLDHQVGTLPAIPSRIGERLESLDESRRELVSGYLRMMGYELTYSQTVEDWACCHTELRLGDYRLRLLPPHDRFTIVTILVGIIADHAAATSTSRLRRLIILEYPEASGQLGIILDLIQNTPALEWIVISRLEIPTRLPIIYW